MLKHNVLKHPFFASDSGNEVHIMSESEWDERYNKPAPYSNDTPPYSSYEEYFNENYIKARASNSTLVVGSGGSGSTPISTDPNSYNYTPSSGNGSRKQGDNLDFTLGDTVLAWSYLNKSMTTISDHVTSLSSIQKLDGVDSGDKYEDALKCVTGQGPFNSGFYNDVKNALERSYNVRNALLRAQGYNPAAFDDLLKVGGYNYDRLNEVLSAVENYDDFGNALDITVDGKRMDISIMKILGSIINGGAIGATTGTSNLPRVMEIIDSLGTTGTAQAGLAAAACIFLTYAAGLVSESDSASAEVSAYKQSAYAFLSVLGIEGVLNGSIKIDSDVLLRKLNGTYHELESAFKPGEAVKDIVTPDTLFGNVIALFVMNTAVSFSEGYRDGGVIGGLEAIDEDKGQNLLQSEAWAVIATCLSPFVSPVVANILGSLGATCVTIPFVDEYGNVDDDACNLAAGVAGFSAAAGATAYAAATAAGFACPPAALVILGAMALGYLGTVVWDHYQDTHADYSQYYIPELEGVS